MTKGIDEWIDDGVLQSCEENGRDMTAKRVAVGECDGSRSVGRSLKKWTDTLKDCLRKRVLDVRQARRMVQDRGL